MLTCSHAHIARMLSFTLLLTTLLVALPTSAAPTPQVVQAPVLKWAYGGCFTSWCQTGWYSSPAVADLNNDSQPDVIWGSYDLVSLNGATGALQWRAANAQRVWPAIAVADLTGDGSLEVVVGRGGDQVMAYRADGSVLWARNPFGNGEVRTLAVADLESDGQQEVVVGRASGGSTRQLSVYQADGNVRDGWPARHDGEAGYGWGMYNENVVVADFTGDGTREIIGPTDTHYITALDRDGNQLPANAIYGAGKVWSQVGVHVDHTVDLRGYADCGTEHRPNFANSAPIASDLDRNGIFEMIVVGDVYNCGVGDPDGDMYQMPWILNLDRTRWVAAGFDWTALPPDPGTRPLSQDYSLIQNAVMNAVAADLDGDGRNELLFPSYDGKLHAYALDKSRPGNWPFDVPGSGMRFASEPVVADLDNDGKAEVIVSSWPQNGGNRLGQLHILDYQGNQLYAVDLPAPRSGSWNGGLGAPTLANIDGDADLEVVLGTVSSGVVVYDLPGSASARVLWGTGRGNMRRTGVAALEEGFSVQANPAANAVSPGSSTSFDIMLTSGDATGVAVDLSATISPAGPTVSLAANQATPPATVTLSVTDNHPTGVFQPGVFYTIEVTATGGGKSRIQKVYLLVGGYRTGLPAVVK
jgi:FG-GAP-like repeat